MKHTTLNPKSPRKIAQLIAEEPIRMQLAYRCGGTPVKFHRKVKLNNGKVLEYNQVVCMGGKCEICGKQGGNELGLLYPHERISRGRGGQLSLQNSIMCHNRPCHELAQKNYPQWSK